MEQIEKLNPITVKVIGHRVIVSDEIFSEIINVINKQTEVINKLIDNQTETSATVQELDISIKSLADAITNL